MRTRFVKQLHIIIFGIFSLLLLPVYARARIRIVRAPRELVACEKLLVGGPQIFVGSDSYSPEISIRGSEIEKIRGLLRGADLRRLQELGIRFDQDSTLKATKDVERETVYFNKASFLGIETFFSLSGRFAENQSLLDALESKLMQKIGAIVYGKTATTILVMYADSVKTDPEFATAPFPFRVFNGDILDFTGTSAKDLNRIVSIVEEHAMEKSNQHDLERWAQTVRAFLLEAKMRDDQLPPVDSSSLTLDLPMGHPPGYMGHP